VEDERDLEDLLRALLAVGFDEVRTVTRTPPYAASPRTEFLLSREGVVVTGKLIVPGRGESEIAGELRQDATEYEHRGVCQVLICLIYDPEGRLREPKRLEAAWSISDGALPVRSIITT
jgi:hypothetical protein